MNFLIAFRPLIKKEGMWCGGASRGLNERHPLTNDLVTPITRMLIVHQTVFTLRKAGPPPPRLSRPHYSLHIQPPHGTVVEWWTGTNPNPSGGLRLPGQTHSSSLLGDILEFKYVTSLVVTFFRHSPPPRHTEDSPPSPPPSLPPPALPPYVRVLRVCMCDCTSLFMSMHVHYPMLVFLCVCVCPLPSGSARASSRRWAAARASRGGPTRGWSSSPPATCTRRPACTRPAAWRPACTRPAAWRPVCPPSCS